MPCFGKLWADCNQLAEQQTSDVTEEMQKDIQADTQTNRDELMGSIDTTLQNMAGC